MTIPEPDPTVEPVPPLSPRVSAMQDIMRKATAHALAEHPELADDPPMLARTVADLVQADGCTGLTAKWCPVCGDCRCSNADEEGAPPAMDNVLCLLHNPGSPHAEAERFPIPGEPEFGGAGGADA